MTRPLLRRAAVFCLASSTLLPAFAHAQARAAEEEEEADEPAPKQAPKPAPKQAPTADEGGTYDEDEGYDDEPAPSAPKAPAKSVPRSEEDMEGDGDAEAELEEEGVSLTQPPAKGKGAIVGIITDTKFSEAIIEGRVQIIGQKREVFTDADGRFRLELPPGTYSIRISYEMHQPSRVDKIKVESGELVRVDAQLTPDDTAIETVEIEEEVDHTSLEGQTLQRQRSASVGDGVGRAEIARTPDRNAAEAAQRVVGATIVGNRFVYVRGLGERYTNSLLNGAPLPSPEPDRAAIPLDLFPSLILENITIVKTFTPDSPGDFAGGSVRIDTRELPTKPLFQLSLGGGVDSRATFRDRLSHPGSSTDWLGYDHSTRSLPEGFPSYVILPRQPLPGHTEDECKTKPEDHPESCITTQDALDAGRKINSTMHPRRSFTPPNYSLSAVAGNGWALGKEQRIGVLGTLNYGRSYRLRNAKVKDYFPKVDPVTNQEVIGVENDIESEQGEDKVTWGALGSVSYWPSLKHRLTLTGLHTQLADATTNFSTGTYENFQGPVKSVQMRYASRALNMLQLRGEHDFTSLNRAQLTWNASYSVASRDEPDTRTTAYNFNEVRNEWSALGNGTNGIHQFSEQAEKQLGAGLDWTQPITSDPERVKMKLGGLVSNRDRDYKARRFAFDQTLRSDSTLFKCGDTYTLNCPEKLFQWGNIGDIITPKETTFPDDAYKAGLDVYAGYVMFDANVVEDIRVVAGARVEHTDQFITPYSQFADGKGATPGAKTDNTDVLPALSIAYSATKKTKLRVALSQTLARPQLRELSPSTYSDYFNGRQLSGNTKLRMTYIKNADLRLETFPTPREVLAFSVFYKLFKDPIEPYVTANQVVSFQNAEGARLLGVEIEGRKSLGFVSKSLSDLSAIANLTLAHSEIELNEDQGDLGIIVTNEERAMVNQAPYVLNVALDYDNEERKIGVRLLGNVVGPRIVSVGTQGIDDEYEQPKFSLDFTATKGFGKHLSFRFTAVNLLNSAWVRTLGEKREGALETYREKEGRVYTLTGTYTY